jgi:hypothetical protein
MLGSDAMSAAKNNTGVVLKHKIAKFVGASQSFKEIEEIEIFHLSLIILMRY